MTQKKKRFFYSDAMESLWENVLGLRSIGLIDDVALAEFEDLCFVDSEDEKKPE